MQRDLMEILACPVCKGELTLTVTKTEMLPLAEDGQKEIEEIVDGSLHCAACDETYPIDGGIPNLLPPDLRTAMAAEAVETQ